MAVCFPQAQIWRQIHQIEPGLLCEHLQNSSPAGGIWPSCDIDHLSVAHSRGRALLKVQDHGVRCLKSFTPFNKSPTAGEGHWRKRRQAFDKGDLCGQACNIRSKTVRDGHLFGFGPRPRPRHNQTALQAFWYCQKARGEGDFIGAGIHRFGHDIHREPRPPQSAVAVKHQLEIIEICALWLAFPSVGAVIIKHQCHRGFCRANIWHLCQLLCDLGCLSQGRGGAAVGTQKACVHLLLGEWRLPPAEIAHGFCAMGKSLPSPKSRHAG